MPLSPVTASGGTNIFFSDHQAKPGMPQTIILGQDQQLRAGHFNIRFVEHLLEVSRGA